MLTLQNLRSLVQDVQVVPLVSLSLLPPPAPSVNEVLKRSHLTNGDKLHVGQYLVSNSEANTIQLQRSGDLCLFTSHHFSTTTDDEQNKQHWKQQWCLGTSHVNPSYMEVNENSGCLQLVTTSGQVYWRSGQCYTESGTFLSLQDDGNLVLYSNRNHDSHHIEWACGGDGPFSYYDIDGAYHTDSISGSCPTTNSPKQHLNLLTDTVLEATPINRWHGNCLINPNLFYVGDYLVSPNNNYVVQLLINGDFCRYSVPSTSTGSYADYIKTTHSDWTVQWCLGTKSNNPSHMNVNLALGQIELVDTSGTVYWYQTYTNPFYLALRDSGGPYLIHVNGAWNTAECLTNIPTYQPSDQPSYSFAPTMEPTEEPTFHPSYSLAPTFKPTLTPSSKPSSYTPSYKPSVASCPSEFTRLPSTGQCYKVVTDGLNWFDAERFCNSIGSHLASISSNDEYTDFYQYLLTPNGLQYNQIWIGGNDITSEGIFTWIDGSTFSYTKWVSGQPDNQYNLENCVYLSYGMYDTACSNIMSSICMYQDTPITSPLYSSESSCPTGYTYHYYTCLRADRQMGTFYEAETFCKTNGNGKLAIVPTLAENRWFREFTTLTQSAWYTTFIGGTQTYTGDWVWYTTYDSISYNNWYYGNVPNDVKKTCMAFERNPAFGQWADHNCDWDAYPLCQVAPSGPTITSSPTRAPTPLDFTYPPNWSGCPTGFTYLPSTSKCYILNTNLLNWFDAERYCNSIGAYLTSIESLAEENDMYHYLIVGNTVGENIWIGANDISIEGQWTWNDRSMFNYTHWDVLEPNSGFYNDEHCVSMNGGYNNNKWYDQPCAQQMMSVCKYAEGASLSSPVYASSTFCQDGTTYFHGVCLAITPYVVDTPENAWCDYHYLNGQLALPTTLEENRWYYEFVRYSSFTSVPIYLDATRTSDGRWVRLSTQKEISFTNWGYLQTPAYFNDADNYVRFYIYANDGTWCNMHYAGMNHALCLVTPSGTAYPTSGPTFPPTLIPTGKPSTAFPTYQVTTSPTFTETKPPTFRPTTYPTIRPTSVAPTLKPTSKSEFWTNKPVRYTDDFRTMTDDDHRNADDDSYVAMIIVGPVLAGVVPFLLIGLWYLRAYYLYRQAHIAIPAAGDNEYAPTGGGGYAQPAQYQPISTQASTPSPYDIQPSAPPTVPSYVQPLSNHNEPVHTNNPPFIGTIQPNVPMPMAKSAYPTGYTSVYNYYTVVPYGTNEPVQGGEFQMVPTTYVTSVYAIPSSYEPVPEAMIAEEFSYEDAHNVNSVAIVPDYDVL